MDIDLLLGKKSSLNFSFITYSPFSIFLKDKKRTVPISRNGSTQHYEEKLFRPFNN
jgi:hypothetical protein